MLAVGPGTPMHPSIAVVSVIRPRTLVCRVEGARGRLLASWTVCLRARRSASLASDLAATSRRPRAPSARQSSVGGRMLEPRTARCFIGFQSPPACACLRPGFAGNHRKPQRSASPAIIYNGSEALAAPPGPRRSEHPRIRKQRSTHPCAPERFFYSEPKTHHARSGMQDADTTPRVERAACPPRAEGGVSPWGRAASGAWRSTRRWRR